MIQYRGKNKIRQRNNYLKAEFGGNIMGHNLLSWKMKLFLITSVPSLRTKVKSRVKISERVKVVLNRPSNLDKRTYRNLQSVVSQKPIQSSSRSKERGMFAFCEMK